MATHTSLASGPMSMFGGQVGEPGAKQKLGQTKHELNFYCILQATYISPSLVA